MKASRLNIEYRQLIPLLLFTFLIVSGCSDLQIKKELKSIEESNSIARAAYVVYPFNSTIFPPEIAPPLFEWNDSTGLSTAWNVFICDSLNNIVLSSKTDKNKWRPDVNDWEKIKSRSSSTNYSFTAIARRKVNKIFPVCRIQFSISVDSVGADIFYRAVTLPFSYAVKNVNTIEWYLGSVNGEKPRKMLDNLPVCGNCHSFSQEKPLLAMDVDYGNDKGSYVIAETIDTCNLTPENIITWSDYRRNDGEPTFGLLSQISPDGNHVLSTVKDLSIFVAVDDNLAYSQLFFPIKGIIGIYDREKDTFDDLNGANDSKYVQSNPSWSPDGKKVVFARTEAYVNEKVKEAGIALLSIDDVDEFSSGGKQFKFNLYSVDFNDGRGGVASPLEGASHNGKSNYFPKFSPDGKWIVFCQAENFMLLQPDSRLYIMPSEGGKPRLMNCNMENMNSWHSWSPNGKWIVFSSKQHGLYTQLYLTHIDENGMDSPPVLLENLCFEKRAANIPEFYPFSGDKFRLIKDNFSHTSEYFNRGAFDKMSNKYYKRAYDDLDKAIATDSNYLETYFNRIMLNSILKQSGSKEDRADKNKAMQLIRDSLSVNPSNLNYITLKISLLSSMGNVDEAIKEAKKAIKKYPRSYKVYDLLSSIYRKKNQYKNAIECYQKMLSIDPGKKRILHNLIAGAYLKLNDYDKALNSINAIINEYHENHDLLYTRAQIFLNRNNVSEAKGDIDMLVADDSTNYQYNELLAQYYAGTGNKRLFSFQKRKILQILNDCFRKNPEDVEVVFQMASIYMSFNDYENAEKLYDLILRDFPVNYEALKQKAKIKLSTQKWFEAIAIYNQLENNYPPEEEFYNNKAIAYIKTGNFSKALDYFNKTLQLNPNNRDALFNRNKLQHERANRE
ncbi:MAG: tetratricopeptide repeat protein [Prolixibacteraceae bacterium]|nr:tetratricopeptide repeat protein [Prolixibacteraceae bacterium]